MPRIGAAVILIRLRGEPCRERDGPTTHYMGRKLFSWKLREGEGRVLPSPVPPPNRSLGVFAGKFSEILENSEFVGPLRAGAVEEARLWNGIVCRAFK